MKDICGRFLVMTGALALAGCATAAPNHSPLAQGSGEGSTQSFHMESPVQLAVQLINEARVPAGAVRSATAPTPSLAHPPDGGAATTVTLRDRWWRVNGSAADVYAWISHHQSAAVASIGSSATGGPTLGDIEHDADFAPHHLPTTISSAQLSIAVAPLSAHTSAIGAFATVVRQPPRPQTENVPLSVDKVTVLTRRTTGEPDGGQVIARDTVTGVAARALVRDFDALSVLPPEGNIPCPMSQYTQTATFSGAGHVWSATSGVCGVEVTLDGQSLPTLQPSNAYTHDLQAAYGHRLPGVLGPQPLTNPSTATSSVTS